MTEELDWISPGLVAGLLEAAGALLGFPEAAGLELAPGAVLGCLEAAGLELAPGAVLGCLEATGLGLTPGAVEAAGLGLAITTGVPST